MRTRPSQAWAPQGFVQTFRRAVGIEFVLVVAIEGPRIEQSPRQPNEEPRRF
jgi:hypothetical protein